MVTTSEARSGWRRRRITLAEIAMDEVEFQRAYNNLRVLINELRDDPRLCNPMLVIAAMLDSLNQRITDMQLEEDDE